MSVCEVKKVEIKVSTVMSLHFSTSGIGLRKWKSLWLLCIYFIPRDHSSTSVTRCAREPGNSEQHMNHVKTTQTIKKRALWNKKQSYRETLTHRCWVETCWATGYLRGYVRPSGVHACVCVLQSFYNWPGPLLLNESHDSVTLSASDNVLKNSSFPIVLCFTDGN